MLPIVLASSSRYRHQLLSQLGLTFEWASPDIDESALPHETPQTMAARLAESKARALAPRYANHLVIGSDQTACLDGRILGKPGNFATAQLQLRACNGRRVEFSTGLCVLNTSTDVAQTIVEPFAVIFRQLSNEQIDRYLTREEPFDCAGSFKVEGLGIALFERLEGNDPNALIGLPLIRLVTLLQAADVAVI